MSGDELFADLEKISDWVRLENHPRTEHGGAMQMMKLSEEVGEAMEAYLGWKKQNLRKSDDFGLDDVLIELADVILAAWCNIQWFTEDPDGPRMILARRAKAIIKRAEI